jgi:phosphatidylglycerol---prolipoprotein diacylglyceryl transferase
VGDGFAQGAVSTVIRVQPKPPYDAQPALVFAACLIGSGASRFVVEFARINPSVTRGLTAPQLWSLAAVAVGVVLTGTVARRVSQPRAATGTAAP